MPTQRLRALLGELHQELTEQDDIDPEGVDLLRGIHDEIEELVGVPHDERRAPGLIDRLRNSVETFEGSHPRLTAVIQRITDTLAGAGI